MAGNQVNKNTQNNNDTLKKQADEQLKRTQKRFSVSDIGGTLKRILSYALNYKWFFVFAMLFKGLSSGLNVTTNAMLKPIINHAVDGSPMETIVKYLILLLVMYVGAVVSFYLGERFIVKMAQNVIRKIRGDLFSHLQKLPIRFYDSRSHGDLMSTFTNDIDNLNAAIARGVRSVTLGGQTVTYSTTDALIKARNDLQAQLNAQNGKRRSKQTYLFQNGRGY